LYDRQKANDFTLLSEIYIKKVSEILKKQFDIIQIEYTKYLSVINLLPDSPLKIFVEIESRYAVYRDFVDTFNIKGAYPKYLIENSKFLESSYMSKYDLILALSNDDVKRLEGIVANKQILLSQYSVLEEHFRPLSEIQDYQPTRVIFMGSQSHEPNKDAVEWMINEIWPYIRKKKNIDFLITGKWSSEFIEKYKNVDGLVFTGFLDDLSPVLHNSILVVPIRIGGGGLRAKVIQAMAFGVPVVSTSLGCDGIGAIDGESILVADSEIKFIEAVSMLLENSELSQKILSKARQLIEENYSSQVTGKKRDKIYQALLRKKLQPSK
jgi:glycosyltransferase involved in cell wall biosynthesis